MALANETIISGVFILLRFSNRVGMTGYEWDDGMMGL